MMSTADLQDLSTQGSPDANPDVLASGPTVSADDAANAVSKRALRYKPDQIRTNI